MLPLKVGDNIDFYVYNNEQIYQLIGVVEEKLVIKIPALGVKEAFTVRPYISQGGKKLRRERLWLILAAINAACL